MLFSIVLNHFLLKSRINTSLLDTYWHHLSLQSLLVLYLHLHRSIHQNRLNHISKLRTVNRFVSIHVTIFVMWGNLNKLYLDFGRGIVLPLFLLIKKIYINVSFFVSKTYINKRRGAKGKSLVKEYVGDGSLLNETWSNKMVLN